MHGTFFFYRKCRAISLLKASELKIIEFGLTYSREIHHACNSQLCVTSMNSWFKEFNIKELAAEVRSFQNFSNKKKIVPSRTKQISLGLILSCSSTAVWIQYSFCWRAVHKLLANCSREVSPSVNLA